MNNATINPNATSADEAYAISSLQAWAVILKLANFVDIVIEMIIWFIELYLLHNLEKSGLKNVGTYSEQERRQRFAKRIMWGTIFWLIASGIGFMVVQFVVEAETCGQLQSIEWFSICSSCKVEGCLDCTFGGINKCDECDKGFYFDTENRKCTDCDAYENNRICERCDGPDICLECAKGYKLGQEGD